MWGACDSHVRPMWCSCGSEKAVFALFSIYRSCLFTWQMNMWFPCSVHVIPMWGPCGVHVIPMWSPCSVHVSPMWCSSGSEKAVFALFSIYRWCLFTWQMNMWFPCEAHVVFMWFPCDSHVRPMWCSHEKWKGSICFVSIYRYCDFTWELVRAGLLFTEIIWLST